MIPLTTDTIVFDSFVSPIYVVLTFDRWRYNVSVRSHSPQPVEAMFRVQAIFHQWVQSLDVRKQPVKPPSGWRISDGAGKVAPFPAPDQLH